MALIGIEAHFECDGCGKRFEVGMDAADYTNEATPTLIDLAEDTLRGGNPITGECGSVQAELHLCRACTNLADEIGDEAHTPSRQEILEATGAL